MPVTAAFLASCRSDVEASPELAAFRAAQASVGVGTRAERAAAWGACYDDNRSQAKSPATRLRQAIRGVVHARAMGSGTLSRDDRESAYQTLAQEFAPDYPQPPTTARESEELQRVLLEDLLS